MKERKIEFTFRNILFYVSGFILIGLGVNLLLRAELGAGAWDTVNYNFNALFPELTLGMCSFIFAFIIWSIVMVYRRQSKFFFVLIPLLLVSVSIDLWDLFILSDIMPGSLVEQFVWFIFGIIILPLSLSLVISSNFPAFVFDELMIMMHEVLKTKDVGSVRIGIELFAVALAIVFWLIADVEMDPNDISGADIGLGSISYGTFVFAVTIGPTIQLFLKVLEKK